MSAATKGRLSASVDPDLLRAAEASVARGRARNVSSWVNDALRMKLEEERRLDALAAFVQAYEAEHGVISEAEQAEATRRARARAIVVRGRTPRKRASR
jgi:Arc/MetJ-type ribon-helix-helix transcriptional regulator